VQVLNEFANVLRIKPAMALPDVEVLCATLIDTCDVIDLSVRTHQTALTLMSRYNLSVYEALKAHTVVVIDLALVLLAQDVWQVATDKGDISRALQRAGNSELPVMR